MSQYEEIQDKLKSKQHTWLDVRNSLADFSKIGSKIGYLPKCNVRDGLESAFLWYENNVK